MPPTAEVHAAVADQLGERVEAIRCCMTYSRSCTHSWSAGACGDCPSADHIPW